MDLLGDRKWTHHVAAGGPITWPPAEVLQLCPGSSQTIDARSPSFDRQEGRDASGPNTSVSALRSATKVGYSWP